MKLKACPFCGEDAAKVCEVPSDSDYKIIVRCSWCWAQTTPRNNEVIASQDWNGRARVAGVQAGCPLQDGERVRCNMCDRVVVTPASRVEYDDGTIITFNEVRVIGKVVDT